MSYLIAASLICHTWTVSTFNLPREIFLCAHMQILAFCDNICQKLFFTHVFEGCAWGKFGFDNVLFFE